MFSDSVAQFDDAVDRLVDPIRKRPWADRLFYTASELGDFGLLWVIFALLRALRGGRTNERAAIRGIVATGIESVLVNVILKSFFGRGRPIKRPDHPLPLRQPKSSSFPSGHTTAAFCGAVLLSEDDPLAPAYFAAASVVALSRIYVRAHHASDVAGGVLVGLGLGWIGRKLVRLHPHARRGA
ncbi:MAG TPA: phosphatase PAP2 family protein [Acidimicrobiales bacterium]|jgi:undecaprenyl-diphosphatase|nr:phosphatase PAP2 family protein [Acidimicrobiales bacterium]